MNIVTLQNPGLIDLRAVQFMGVNAKDSDSAIGYFGTGLKFAIATLLRSGHEVTLWRGLDRYEFTSKIEEIRGKKFGLIHMNDQPLGMTTDLGKNWKCWMAMRELYSNMLDEHGGSHVGEAKPKEGFTSIQVVGQPFYDEYLKRGEIFIENRVPLWKNEAIEIYEGRAGTAFYRGIRVNQLMYPSQFTYNLLAPCDLSEDRMLQSLWTFDDSLANAVVTCDNKELIKKAINVDNENHLEYHINFLVAGDYTSPEFLDAVEESPRNTVSRSALKLWLRSERGKHIPEFDPYEPTPQDLQRLAKARAAILRLGYTDEYPLKFVVNLGNNSRGLILGKAKDEKIWIASRVFEMGTKALASTLYEEWVHLKLGYTDKSYAMQTFLFDKIITLTEELNGEVL